MKNIFIILSVGLFACNSSSNLIKPQTSSNASLIEMAHSPIKISSGMRNGVRWECSQEESNDKLVWIKCQFNNLSPLPNYYGTTKICVNLSYSNPDNQQVVAAIKPICSSNLMPGEQSEGFVAFRNVQRQNLNTLCGVDGQACSMLTASNN